MEDLSVLGVNEKNLDRLVLELSEISDRIKIKLDEIDQLVSDTASYFVCDSGNKFRAKFAITRENFPLVNTNISSMSSDLVNAKKRFNNVEHIIKDNLSEAKRDVQSKSLNEYNR